VLASANPLIPTGYDILWSVIAIALFALVVAALISLVRNARALTTVQALVWTLLVLFVPLFGALAWLFVGRPSSAAAVARAD
jgi:drug/metabolite transporter (DMT)-like permease